MKLQRLDHVNIRTGNLPAMIAWYRDVLGLEPGPRPEFPFGGAWLYLKGSPIVHLVEVEHTTAQKELTLEHFAISAVGMAEFLDHLRGHRVGSRGGVAPTFDIRQVNIWDPDGNHIHIDFPAEEPGEPGSWEPD